VDVLFRGGDNISRQTHNFILGIWGGGSVLKDWINAILVSIYKGKGSKSNCGDYRGISLLGSVGKVFARLLLDRLEKSITPSFLPETQSGFRSGRGTTDMIFSARQLQEKCIEQNLPPYQVFVDLSKAFVTINRNALWVILEKFGCPKDFVAMIRSFTMA